MIIPKWVAAHFASVLLVSLATSAAAQETFGRITPGNGEATLTVFDNRPLERAAQTLAHDFGVRISVEDPLYMWEGDLVEAHRTSAGVAVMVPKPLLLEASFAIGSDGRPSDVPALLATLIARVSIERPFGYRVDVEPGGYVIVPTRMRNEHGELVAYSSPLETMVTLPRTVKLLAVHAEAIRDQVEAHSGYRFACCTVIANNFDLQTTIEFGADHESARHALQRLALLRPEPVEQHMRCQPLTRLCFVQWTPLTQARPTPIPD